MASIRKSFLSTRKGQKYKILRNTMTGLFFLFWNFRDTRCTNDFGLAQFIDAMMNARPDVIFGPSCEYTLGKLQDLLLIWKIAHLMNRKNSKSLTSQTTKTNLGGGGLKKTTKTPVSYLKRVYVGGGGGQNPNLRTTWFVDGLSKKILWKK